MASAISIQFRFPISVRWGIILLAIGNSSCASFKANNANTVLDATFEKYYAYHNVEMINTTVTDELIVNGALTACNSRINKLSTNGNASISSSVINSTLSINGKLQLAKTAVKSTIIGNGTLVANHAKIKAIDMSAQTITLTNTVVGQIRVRDLKNAIIYLKEGSVVTGNIVFDTGYGTVMVDKTSRVKGSVSGKFIQKNMLQINIGHNKKQRK